MTHESLFSPLQLGGMTIRNRIIFGPHVTNHWPGHTADADTVAYYEERAKGGVGMVIIGAASVDENADNYPATQAGLWSDAVIPGLAGIGQATHRHDAKVLIQLIHPGLHQNPERHHSHAPAVSASQIPDVGRPFYVPRALDIDEIPALVDKFGAAAERAKAAGLDGVEIQFGHGYLISQFLTPLKNKRDDAYGGSLENRFRFGRQVIDAVRDSVGPDFVIGVRMNNSDMYEGGLEATDYAEVATMIEATDKVDYISVSTGLLRSMGHLVPSHYADLEPGYQAPRTQTLRRAVRRIPVFQVGKISSPDLAEQLIRDGIDAVVLVRELIADPFWAQKAERHRVDQIRPCVYWNQGCVGRSNTGMRIECSLNPATAHERSYGEGTVKPAANPRRILVIGGGPAGMECARVASLRGHDVVLYEATERLGGQARHLAALPHRGEVANWSELARTTSRAGGCRDQVRPTAEPTRHRSSDPYRVAGGDRGRHRGTTGSRRSIGVDNRADSWVGPAQCAHPRGRPDRQPPDRGARSDSR